MSHFHFLSIIVIMCIDKVVTHSIECYEVCTLPASTATSMLGQSQVCDGAADCLTGRNEEDCTIIAPSLNTTSPCYNNLYLRHNIALVRLNRDTEDHCTTGTWAGSSLTGNVVRGLTRLVCT